MNRAMQTARRELESFLEGHPATKGLRVRVRGAQLILGREAVGPAGQVEPDDRLRLSPLGSDRFGLSVRRHTGRWEQTPFTGSLEELVEVICTTMQHLVAEWP